MNPKIPVPTDNIYKFFATFGLVLMAVSLTLMVLNSHTANEEIWQKAETYFDLQERNDPRKSDREELIESKINIAIQNREVGRWFLAGVFNIGLVLSGFGFFKWVRKVQPIHDEILELQRNKLKLEVEALNQSRKADA